MGPLVKLVNTTARSPFSGTGVVKHVVKYVRPYRQSPQVRVLPALSNVMVTLKVMTMIFLAVTQLRHLKLA
ncbi:hypothetical protein L3X07_01780 [Levilactobacillus brevis]|nr:hypothetical protein [Levilactobacillus brevis]